MTLSADVTDFTKSVFFKHVFATCSFFSSSPFGFHKRKFVQNKAVFCLFITKTAQCGSHQIVFLSHFGLFFEWRIFFITDLLSSGFFVPVSLIDVVARLVLLSFLFLFTS